ncbi:uncharacterized protein LOC126379638 [Pectinophora gossypiella]|uniref:uncharacterized protein LOC126379638 n=1 Tax=Pectinophora gossypiella TaxID=13191 RepID=UPI00214ED7D9|nr:uncharacterized protein LOC126379638 [Pectinophora gossypiella]
MDRKTRNKVVVKSKSSNSAITTKSKSPIRANARNKKSWSSAEFKNKINKKRGVYVEKKSTNLLNSRGKNEDTGHQKPSKRPRKSQKGFLDSVLNILSQDTTGTQYPDASDLLKPGKHRRIRRRTVETVDKGIQDLDAMSGNSSPFRYRKSSPLRMRQPSPQRRKFKSRILNDHVSDRLVVLQPRKELNHTPSNQSEGASKDYVHKKKWPDSPLVQYLEQETNMLQQQQNPDIKEGKKLKKTEALKMEEPATMVGELKTSAKSLYNFFVDLLETTFSVYNMNAEYNEKVHKESNVNFEIDEKVAKKLTLATQPTIDYVENNNINHTGDDIKRDTVFYIRNDDIATDRIEVYKTKPRCSNMNPPLRPRKRSPGRNLRSESFSYTQPYKVDSPTNRSAIKPKGSFNKKNRKQNLLNLLKEELRMEEDAFDEPQTMHQALKLIAKNKRRCRRAIRFDESACPDRKTKTPDDGHPDCMFKRRKVISSSTKSSRRKKLFRIFNPQTTFMQSMRTSGIPRKFSTTRPTLTQSDSSNDNYNYAEDDYKTASFHSIVVEGYDYEPDFSMRQNDIKNKAIIYAYHSRETILTESLGSSKDCLDSIPSKASTSISQLLLKTPDMY